MFMVAAICLTPKVKGQPIFDDITGNLGTIYIGTRNGGPSGGSSGPCGVSGCGVPKYGKPKYYKLG